MSSFFSYRNEKFKSYFAVILALIWPFLHYYSHNFYQIGSKERQVILVTFLVLLVLTSMFLFFINSVKVINKHFFKISTFLVFAIVLTFQFGFLRQNFPAYDKYIYILLLLSLLLFSLKFSGKKMTELVIIFALVPVASSLSGVIYKEFTNKKIDPFSGRYEDLGLKLKQERNVYYFILDGYSGELGLRKILNYDNSNFYKKLKKQKFKILDKSFANYPTSFMSISSALNMNYHVKEGVRKDKTREKFGKLLQGQNQSVLTFKNLGYQYIHFSNKFWKLSKCRFNYDICLPEIYTKEGLSGSLGSFYNHEFRNTFIGMTPLLGLINKVVSKNTLGDDVIPNNGIKYLNKWINDNVDNTKKPFFMFAHTFAVHQPYVYSKGCGVRKDADMKPPNNDIEAYLNEVSCMNNDILSLVETIEKRDPNAIIILQGDHGSETNLQLSKHPLSEWSDNDILERYSIFNAVKAPKECKNKFYNSMSPVNTLRGVLSCLSDKDLNNLEDQYYYAAYENMENFEVVEVVKRIKKLFLDK